MHACLLTWAQTQEGEAGLLQVMVGLNLLQLPCCLCCPAVLPVRLQLLHQPPLGVPREQLLQTCRPQLLPGDPCLVWKPQQLQHLQPRQRMPHQKAPAGQGLCWRHQQPAWLHLQQLLQDQAKLHASLWQQQQPLRPLQPLEHVCLHVLC
jgi:hypothetical protein